MTDCRCHTLSASSLGDFKCIHCGKEYTQNQDGDFCAVGANMTDQEKEIWRRANPGLPISK